MKFTLPFPPSLNMMYPRGKNGKRYLSKRGQVFKKEAQWLIKAERPSLIEGDIQADIRLYRPRKAGDIDNYVKPIFDALEGFCFKNDNQIRKYSVERFEDKDNPRVEVTIQDFSAGTD